MFFILLQLQLKEFTPIGQEIEQLHLKDLVVK